MDGDIWKRSIGTAPLLQRVWVYQERLSTPRMHHFGTEQVLWECHQEMLCESHSNGLSNGAALSMSNPIRAMQLATRDVVNRRILQVDTTWDTIMKTNTTHEKDRIVGRSFGGPEPTSLDSDGSWNDLVEGYSLLQLTYEEDKLVALSGIASQVQSYRDPDDEYLAGLWRKSLPFSLLWYSRDSFRPQKYCAPSWPWTSVEGKIKHSGEDRVQCVVLLNVLDARVSLATSNTTGQVESGYLKFRGRIATTVYRGKDLNGEHFLYADEPAYGHGHWYPDQLTSMEGSVLCLIVVRLRVIPDGEVLRGITLSDDGCPTGQYKRTGYFELMDHNMGHLLSVKDSTLTIT